MKRVMIHAYLAGNLGDDLFVVMLCRRYPNIKFHILADESYKQKFQDLKNCRIFSENDFIVKKINHFLQKRGISRGFWKLMVRGSKAVIHIGGSSFVQHYDDWSAFFGTDLYLAEKSKGLYLIGSNFGPFTDPNYLSAYHNLFQKYKGICFRDQQSYQLFSDLPHVAWAPDVVFNLHPTLKSKKRKLLIAPVYLENRTGKYPLHMFQDAYLNFHLVMIRHFIQMGYQIVLTGFCVPQGDGIIIQKLYQALDPSQRDSVRCVLYDKNLSSILQEFKESEYVIGTRFHSIILGLLCQCRVFPVIYDQKTANTLETLHFPSHFHLTELNGISSEDLQKGWIRLDPPEIQRLRREAEKQFQWTDILFRHNASKSE